MPGTKWQPSTSTTRWPEQVHSHTHTYPNGTDKSAIPERRASHEECTPEQTNKTHQLEDEGTLNVFGLRDRMFPNGFTRYGRCRLC